MATAKKPKVRPVQDIEMDLAALNNAARDRPESRVIRAALDEIHAELDGHPELVKANLLEAEAAHRKSPNDILTLHRLIEARKAAGLSPDGKVLS